MPEVIFVEADGTEHVVEVSIGTSLMQAAVNQLIPGIEGDCGGLCACGTCHVHLPVEWQDKVPAADELELSMLEFAYEVDASSRLSCQIHMEAHMAGIRVMMPTRQY